MGFTSFDDRFFKCQPAISTTPKRRSLPWHPSSSKTMPSFGRNKAKTTKHPIRTIVENIKYENYIRLFPQHFTWGLEKKLQEIKQGTQSVEEYCKEMESSMIRANMDDSTVPVVVSLNLLHWYNSKEEAEANRVAHLRLSTKKKAFSLNLPCFE
jgi:hypothetical protein